MKFLSIYNVKQSMDVAVVFFKKTFIYELMNLQISEVLSVCRRTRLQQNCKNCIFSAQVWEVLNKVKTSCTINMTDWKT